MSSVLLPEFWIWWLFVTNYRNVFLPHWPDCLRGFVSRKPKKVTIILTDLGIAIKYQPPIFGYIFAQQLWAISESSLRPFHVPVSFANWVSLHQNQEHQHAALPQRDLLLSITNLVVVSSNVKLTKTTSPTSKLFTSVETRPSPNFVSSAAYA